MSNLTSNDTFLQTFPADLEGRKVETALSVAIVLVCAVGMVGNAIVIYFFSTRIKPNQSTIYILNLAVADLLFSIGCCIFFLYFLCRWNLIHVSAQSKKVMANFAELIVHFSFSASLFFLAALSCERCLSVCFPLWYKCRRPIHLSGILCAVIWGLSLTTAILERFPNYENRPSVYKVTSALFLLITILMVGSSAVLLIQIRKSSMQPRPLKLYIVVVVAILNYLLSLAPSRVLRMVFFFAVFPTPYMKVIALLVICLCSALNSAANPYIYIVVGRWKKKKISTAEALELAFQEDTNQTSEGNVSMGDQQAEIVSKSETSEVGSNLSG